MPTIGELTGWNLDPEKAEEAEIREELLRHSCQRCVVEKRLKKDRQSEFKLLTALQRSLYKSNMRKPHRCEVSEFRLFKYEKCLCGDVGEVHIELAPNFYGKCNMKHCSCTKYTCADV